ncbi:MAG: O-methyltransferase [Actinomycetaceae bacterium]
MARDAHHSRMITDPKVLAVLDELYEQERHIDWRAYDWHPDPHRHAGTGFSLSPEQGDQLYLLARYGRASNVVEFATSLGFSTLYLATAVRDAGGGLVRTAELVPEKAEQARANIERAGLGEFVEVLVGDARETLAGVPDGIDLALIDGWAPDVSLEVLRVIEPRLRSGALVYNENLDEGFVRHVRAPGSGYRSVTLLSGSEYKPRGELSMRV